MTAKNAISVPVLGKPPKVTLFLSGPGMEAAETHWFGTDNQLGLAMSSVLPLLVDRAILLGTNASMSLVRGSLENVYRDSQAYPGSLPGPSPFNGPADPKQRSLRIRVEAGPLYRKTLFLCMIPDFVVVNSKYSPSSAHGWDGLLRSYLTRLTGGLKNTPPMWGSLFISKDRNLVPRTGLSRTGLVLGENKIEWVTLGPNGLKPGDVFRLRGYYVPGNTAKPRQGLWAVTDVLDARTFKTKAIGPFSTGFDVRGTVQKQVRVFQFYTAFSVGQPTYKKRGGRTFLTPGHKRAGPAGLS